MSDVDARRAERLQTAATVASETVDQRAADARGAMEQYFAELDTRFPTGFDASGAFDGDATTLGAQGGAFVPPPQPRGHDRLRRAGAHR